MIGPLIIVVAVMAGPVGDPAKGVVDRSSDRTAYEAARNAAGHDAAAHVRLALWCEQHGMNAERMKHLAAAVANDPANALARGLLGMVAHNGGWESPDEVIRRTKTDEALAAKLAEYNGRRERLAPTADANWKMALWCEQMGLAAEARAHLMVVTQLDPRREAAWKHLGFKKVGGRWVTEAQIAAEKTEAAAQKRADAYWKPLLTRWRGWLRGRDRTRREEANAGLAAITEPRAVPAVWSILANSDAASQEKAVQVLDHIDAPGAARALAMLAVHGRSPQVRRFAVDALRHRDPRDFLGLLIGVLRDPMKYEVRPGSLPNSPGELFVEGRRYNIVREYFIDSMTYGMMVNLPPRLFDSSVPFDPFGTWNMRLAAQGMMAAGNMGPGLTVQAVPPQGMPFAKIPGLSAHPAAGASQPAPNGVPVISAQALAAERDIQIAQLMVRNQQILEASRQQLRNDVACVEAYNANARRLNDVVVPILTTLTGQDLGSSGEDWQAWWSDQRGYSYSAPDPSKKPTYTDFVQNPIVLHHACFAAGTLVQTLDGPHSIESIRIGDRVLSQDARTGTISFTVVVAVFHNKPAATFRVRVDDQTIVATGIHRLWKAGKGWVMVRELKAGDRVRTLGGLTTVKSVESERVQPVFNLQVAEGESYFVGNSGVLAHDNSTINPVAEPFDATAPLAEAATSARARPRSMLGR